jgi:hypothetical protein
VAQVTEGTRTKKLGPVVKVNDSRFEKVKQANIRQQK